MSRIELHTQGDRAANWILNSLHYPRLHLYVEQRPEYQIAIRVRETLDVFSTCVCRVRMPLSAAGVLTDK